MKKYLLPLGGGVALIVGASKIAKDIATYDRRMEAQAKLNINVMPSLTDLAIGAIKTANAKKKGP